MMKRSVLLSSVLLAALALASSPASALCEPCQTTLNDCVDADVTSSHIAIGGPGSISSNDECGGGSCDNPGKLDQGTIAEAYVRFTLDRTAATLTVEMTNNTDTVASLTAIYFNAPAAVTGMSIASTSKTCALTSDCPPVHDTACSEDSAWQVIYTPNAIQADGFGRFDTYIGNGGDTGNGGGNPIELLADETLTVVLDLTGDLSGLTACHFTTLPSVIPPGENVVTGVGRFQAGFNNGDSGWLGPCSGGGSLVVELKWFRPEPADGEVELSWSTASEIDNAGFHVLRKPELGGPWERRNVSIIPARGSTLSGADYTFVDEGVTNGVRYIYRLEDVDVFQFNTLHRPEMAVPNPVDPPIKLERPAYGRRFADGEEVVLEWNSQGRRPTRVQFSADPTFPEDRRVEFPTRGSRSQSSFRMELNAHEGMLLASVAAEAEGGQIYWRVVELARRGGRPAATSDVQRFGRE